MSNKQEFFETELGAKQAATKRGYVNPVIWECPEGFVLTANCVGVCTSLSRWLSSAHMRIISRKNPRGMWVTK